MKIGQWHSKKIESDPAYARAVAEVAEKQRLADEIVGRRVALGLTQRELADISGLSQPQISRLETGVGNPTSATVARVRAALDAYGARAAAPTSSNVFISSYVNVAASYPHEPPIVTFGGSTVYLDFDVTSSAVLANDRQPAVLDLVDESLRRAA
jgi:transcriptional regulator with XRE-family HTH domain